MKRYERVLVISDEGLIHLISKINDQYPYAKLIQIISSNSKEYYYAILEKEME